jgi:hypothetical protein
MQVCSLALRIGHEVYSMFVIQHVCIPHATVYSTYVTVYTHVMQDANKCTLYAQYDVK